MKSPRYLIKYLIILAHSSSELSYGGSVIGHEQVNTAAPEAGAAAAS